MGNCPACLSSELVHHSNEPEEEGEEEEMVRVLRTTDNELFEFPGPVFVKDLLFGFQGFAVFPNKAHKKKQQPLHPNTQLKFSHIYYLKPWTKPSSFLNPLVNHNTNHNNLLFFAKHTSAKPWLPSINPFINPNNDVNQPLINPLNPSSNPLINTDKYLNTSDNHLNHITEINYLLNDGGGPLKQVIMSSAKPILINEFVGDLSAVNASDRALNELAGDLIAVNSEDKALNELQGALLGPTEKLITINVQDQSALSELAEGLMTINAQDQRAFNELADDLMTLNAQEGALNELAEGIIKINSQQKSSSSDFLMESPSKQGKVMKKVRFAEEVVLITSSSRHVNHMAVASPSLSFCGSGGERNTHSYASISGTHARASISRDDEHSTHSYASNEERVSQLNKQTPCISASEEGLIPYISKKEINGVVRLKVVISKKQLTELMSPRASDKESGALVEKMLSPLLSPTSSSHKSDGFKNGVFHGPPWRPSLNHIPEDISCQD